MRIAQVTRMDSSRSPGATRRSRLPASDALRKLLRMRVLTGALAVATLVLAGCEGIVGSITFEAKGGSGGTGGSTASSATQGTGGHGHTTSSRDASVGDAARPDASTSGGLSTDVTTLAFGKVAKGGQSAEATVTLTNAGDAAISGISTTITGDQGAEFTVTSNTCTGTVAPGGHCEVGVRFSANAVGVAAGLLTIAATGVDQLATVTLSGEGLTPGALAATPNTGAFADTSTTATVPTKVDFTVSNTGAADTGPITVKLDTTSNPAFSISATTCTNAKLTQTSTCVVTVGFAPTVSGSVTGTLLVSATPGGTLPVSLSGKGLAPGSLQISPSSLSFTTPVAAGQTGTETVSFTVSNSGDQNILASVQTSGDTTQFAVTNGCAGQTLAAGGTCPVSVVLSPSARGTKNLTITAGNNHAALTGVAYENFVLTLTNVGTGTGTTTASTGTTTSLSCSTGTCTHTYQVVDQPPSLTITATPDASSNVGTITGACSASGCLLQLTQSSTVTAQYTIKRVQLTTSTKSIGGATGTVSVTGTSTSCGTNCYQVDYGTTLTLTATPAAGASTNFNRSFFSSWAGCTAQGPNCSMPVRADTNVTATFSLANIVFVTSGTYLATDLLNADPARASAVAGADTLCRTAAGTTFGTRTFVSLITSSPSLFTDSKLGSSGGWLRPDGRPFGDGPGSTLFSYGNGRVYYPPNRTEANVALAQNADDTTSGNGCQNWTSTLMADYRTGGVANDGGGGWDTAFGTPCSYAFHLYCMSVDYSVTVAPSPPTGVRQAFVTQGTWTPGGGIGSADTFCRNEAQTGGLNNWSGFQALLPPTGATAASRFDVTKPTWNRPDGVEVFPVATGLNWTTTPALEAAISVTASKNNVMFYDVWGGGSGPGTAGSATGNCTNWTSNSSALAATTGRTYHTNFRFMNDGNNAACSEAHHLYCFEN